MAARIASTRPGHSRTPICQSGPVWGRRPPRCERDEQTLSSRWLSMALDGSRYLSQILTARPMECCRGPRTAQPPPFRLAIGIISDGSGPSRIRDRATLTGRIRSPHYNDKVHRYSTDHDVGSVMGFRDLQAILHCCCSRCARAAVVRPLFAES
jgi:hypothetical protein